MKICVLLLDSIFENPITSKKSHKQQFPIDKKRAPQFKHRRNIFKFYTVPEWSFIAVKKLTLKYSCTTRSHLLNRIFTKHLQVKSGRMWGVVVPTHHCGVGRSLQAQNVTPLSFYADTILLRCTPGVGMWKDLGRQQQGGRVKGWWPQSSGSHIIDVRNIHFVTIIIALLRHVSSLQGDTGVTFVIYHLHVCVHVNIKILNIFFM